jgi:hypothetical protein
VVDFKTSILIKKYKAEIKIKINEIIPSFFIGYEVKTNSIKGIKIRKVMPFSFDIKDRKKLIPPRINDTIEFEKMYLKIYQIETNPKRKQRISSRLLMLSTTSVWIGCAAYRRLQTKGKRRFCFSNNLQRTRNKIQQVIAYNKTLIK